MVAFSLKNLSQIYALIVCLILVFVILFSLIFIAENFVKINYPELRISQSLIDFESNKNYRFYLQNLSRNNPELLPSIEKMSEQELTEKRAYEREANIESTKRNGVSGLITCSQWLLMSTLFFALHWFLYRRWSK